MKKGLSQLLLRPITVVFFALQHASSVLGRPSTGNADCPCIDSTTILARTSNCEIHSVENNSTEPGVLVNAVNCFPLTYGANTCDTHDLQVDPVCIQNPDVPHCNNPWCYVDMEKCSKSQDLVYRTNVFTEKLYYSYSTCGSSADDWLDFDTTKVFMNQNQTLRVALPTSYWPVHFKVDPTTGEDVKFDAPEYYDNTIPWQGWIVDYFNAVVKISNMPNVEYVHRSVGSGNKGYSSMWTQTVTDVEAGVADLAISSFWATTER